MLVGGRCLWVENDPDDLDKSTEDLCIVIGEHYIYIFVMILASININLFANRANFQKARIS